MKRVIKKQQIFYIEADLRDKLHLYCFQKNKTKTEVVVDALQNYLGRYLYVDPDAFKKKYERGIN